jgi:hypothetical protein
MSGFTHTLGAGVLAIAVLTAFVPPDAPAGRIGGPVTETVTLRPLQVASFDVPFARGARATVLVRGDGRANISLRLYDADGNMAEGQGVLARQMASMDVYREGYFRIVVRNNSSTLPTVVRIMTN